MSTRPSQGSHRWILASHGLNSRRQSSGRTGCAGWWPKKPHGTGDLGPGHVGDEKAPAIDGRGKLAERLEVEFGPFRSASRMAECFLVALPPSWVHLRQSLLLLSQAQPAQRRTPGLIP